MTWDKDSKDVFFAFWEALPATIGASTGKNAGHPADSNTEEKQDFNQSMMGYRVGYNGIYWNIMNIYIDYIIHEYYTIAIYGRLSRSNMVLQCIRDEHSCINRNKKGS